jgi:hypothetical protein
MPAHKPADPPTGLSPQDWETQLEAAAVDAERLAGLLERLKAEMEQERTWLHENPTPGGVFKALFRFFGSGDADLERLGETLRDELAAERRLRRRYRSWLPGEAPTERLLPYLKGFGGEIRRAPDGLQFPGFLKFKGLQHNDVHQAFAFFLDARFPGRDPANFHLSFEPARGELVIERVYKKELPRPPRGPSAARAVLAELTRDITSGPQAVRLLVVDNAANLDTRQALLRVERESGRVRYRVRPDAVVERTPLGHLMRAFAGELGLRPGAFRCRVNTFGVLKIELPVEPGGGACA